MDAHSIGALLRSLLAEALRCSGLEVVERDRAAIARPRRDRGGLRLVISPEA